MATLLGLLVLTMAACGTVPESSDRPVLVATTTILGDVLENIAGGEAEVRVLMPVGADPHDYRPSARDTATLVGADFALANGLGLEEGLTDVLDAAVAEGTVVFEVAPRLDPLPFAAESSGNAEEGTYDPHVWMDPVRMAEASRLIAEQLEAVLPGRGWADRAEEYATGLTETDQIIAALIASVPDDRRKLVTNHDALGYFARRYGLEVIGVVIPGGSTLAEPSSASLAALVETIEREDVNTVFAETIEPTTLADAVASEAGLEVEVVELFTDSLGAPDSAAGTLIDLLLTDARLIVAGMGS